MLLDRRAVLRGGLAHFALLMAGCSKRSESPISSTASSTPPTAPSAPVVVIADAGSTAGLSAPPLVSRIAEIGPLSTKPDANGVRLPDGFVSRVVAQTRQRVVSTDSPKPYLWHSSPDGGATFATDDGGWIYVSNSEEDGGRGGAGAIRFDKTGKITDAYSILKGTTSNCSGGRTPWNTWLSCEETATGRVHECDPQGAKESVVWPALGTFKHEAVAIDPLAHRVYLTEDEPDGCLYRYVPDALGANGFADLSAGALEVAKVEDGKVSWLKLSDPTAKKTPTRHQVKGATRFNGGEGVWWHEGVVYFSTKGDNRIHAFDTKTSMIKVIYDAAKEKKPLLIGVDNITVSASGDVLVAEDGGHMKIVALLPSGDQKEIVQLVGYPDSEVTGPAFDPSGERLYFSSQRGKKGGTTFEVTGPFHKKA